MEAPNEHLRTQKVGAQLNAVAPMCCNTFAFDTCNRAVLLKDEDGWGAPERYVSSRFFTNQRRHRHTEP